MKTLYTSLVLVLALGTGAFAQSWGIQMRGGDPAMLIVCDGQLVTKYHTKNVEKPCFYPIIGPTGEGVTRGFPIEPQPDEETDHPHHRGLWFGHGDVNGVDFWHEGRANDGKIVQTGMGSMKMGGQPAMFTTRNDWIGPDGVKVCEDGRKYSFSKAPDGSIAIDVEITLKATEGDVTFGDTKEGTLGIRVLPTMRLKGKVGKGEILNSEGVKNGDAWGKRAKWCDFFGPDRKGEMVGVAIFDHPDNLNYPTWWHARDYGLFAANPFGKSKFEGVEESGAHTIPAGTELLLKYRVYIHPGNPEDANVEGAYGEFSQ